MEADTIGKGKSKGRDKGKSKGSSGKGMGGTQQNSGAAKNSGQREGDEGAIHNPFQGYCGCCGGWRHRQKECKKD